MPSPSRKADWPIIAGVILALVVVALGVYVWGYFALSWPMLSIDDAPDATYYREYNSYWLAEAYRPAAGLESLLTGRDVDTYFYQPGSAMPGPTEWPKPPSLPDP